MAIKQIQRSALSETSTVASKIGQPGEVRFDSDGNRYKLLKVGSITVEKCAAVHLESTNGTDGYTVAPATLAGLGCIAFQNQINSTQTLGAGVYFWGQQYGIGSVNATVTGDVNSRLAVTASGFVVDAATSDRTVCRPLAALADDTPGVAFINCLGGL